jgi:glycosyltransferase involved in cell wall biosynthesis
MRNLMNQKGRSTLSTRHGFSVCHIASTRFGGAGIAASRLHDGLFRQSVDSTFLAEDRVAAAEFGYVSLPPETRTWVQRLAGRLGLATSDRLRWIRKLESTDWNGVVASGPGGREDLLFASDVQRAQIINLHWVAGFLPWAAFFSQVRKPLVWTLHDMQPFKGIFHYTVDRDRAGSGARQLNEQVRSWKAKVLSELSPEKLTVVTPSIWLGRESQASEVLGRFPHRVIPYGLNTQIFRPWPREVARGILNLPQGRQLVLVVAERLDDYRKGLDLAAGALCAEGVLPGWDVVATGAGTVNFPGRTVHRTGSLPDPRLMALLYNAVDLVLVPSREDNLPNVILESLCCGTPVVVTPGGGCAEPVVAGRDGLISQSLDIAGFTKAVAAAADMRFDRTVISEAAASRYDESVTVAAYLELYGSITDPR